MIKLDIVRNHASTIATALFLHCVNSVPAKNKQLVLFGMARNCICFVI